MAQNSGKNAVVSESAHGHVLDISTCGVGDDEAIGGLQGGVGVVVAKNGGQADALLGQSVPGHLAGGFVGGHKDQPSGGKLPAGQRFLHCGVRQNGLNSLSNDMVGVLSQPTHGKPS